MKLQLFFALSLGLGGVLWAGGQANAQNANCAERGQVVMRLAERFGETRQSIGLGQNNALIETFASTTTGTWTILVTLPSGMSCLVASGEGYEQVNEPGLPGGDAA